MQGGCPMDISRVKELFAGMPGARTLVLSALEGQGKVLVGEKQNLCCAVAAAGDFLFCGGEPGLQARQMLQEIMGSHEDWLIAAPGRWMAVLESIAPVKRITRMAFRHDVQPKDEHLRSLLANMPGDASFQPIEGKWIAWCRGAEWSRDFVSQFSDEHYAQHGVGVLLAVKGEIVAGASSYVCYPGGIEIQLQTRDDMQGRGYATLAAARLVLMAHERGLIATWDAANPASGHIAEKLGYEPEGLYQVAVIDKEKKHGVQDL